MRVRWIVGRGSRALMAPLVLAVVLAGPGSGVASASACGSWTVVPSPSPGSKVNDLTSVAAVSAANAWAVGEYSDHAAGLHKTLIERWNGTAWKQVPSPNPAGSTNDTFLYGAAATSAASAWAVGWYSSSGAQEKTLIEQWNGTAWKIVPSANTGTFARLTAVAATSAAHAWAVGSYVKGTAELSLIERWNGTAWKQVPSPNPAGNFGTELDGVAATSATSAWAVGEYRNNGDQFQTLIEHWNGTAWKIVPSPDPGGSDNDNILRGVAATSASNAWAVGDYCTSCDSEAFQDHTLILHWNGSSWKQVPIPGRSGLSGVAATSASNAWAVGGPPEHWNGTAWKQVPIPISGSNGLSGVAATSAANVWVVGSSFNGSNSKTLVIHRC